MYNPRISGGDRNYTSAGTPEAQTPPATSPTNNRLKLYYVEVQNTGAVDAYLLIFDRSTAVSGAENDFVTVPVLIPPGMVSGKTFLPARGFANGIVCALSVDQTQFDTAGDVGIFDMGYDD
jgi:hypothetical protein